MVPGFLKRGQTVEQIPLEKIFQSPFQPRQTFDDEALSGLAESIRENGLIEPIIVRAVKNGYELVAGERRFRAVQKIGKPTIAAMVCDLDDEGCAAWAILENLQRRDLGVFEEAEGLARLLLLWKLPQEAAAKRLGVASSTLSNKLRLLRLSEPVRRLLEENHLSERHARELLRLSSPEEQQKAAAVIAKKGLSVAETEKYISLLLAERKPHPKKPLYVVKDVRLFLNTFEHAMDVMNKAGIGAVSAVSETEEALIYTVRIPKSAALRERAKPNPLETAPAYAACAPTVL